MPRNRNNRQSEGRNTGQNQSAGRRHGPHQDQGEKKNQGGKSSRTKMTNMYGRCENCGNGGHNSNDCADPSGSEKWSERPCEIHPGHSHKNRECTRNPKNTDICKTSNDSKATNGQNMQSQGSHRGQSTRSAPLDVEMHGYVQRETQKFRCPPSKQSDFKVVFCSRCNQTGHNPPACKSPFCFSTFCCKNCKQPGHLTSECRNLAALSKKRESLGDLFRGRPGVSDTFTLGRPMTTWGARQSTGVAGQQRPYQPPAIASLQVKLQAFEDEKAKRRAREISRKDFERRAKSDGIILANHEIQKRAAWLYDDGKTKPFMRLNPYMPPDAASELREFLAEMEKTPQGLWNACELIMIGLATFFRDSAALRAIASGQVPFCRTCDEAGRGADSQGMFLDWKLKPIPIGADVLQIRDDWDDWGVFVFFQCQCCTLGYDYVFSDGKMDWQREFSEEELMA